MSWLVPYERDGCPRCGADLAAPDGELARRCVSCGVTVQPATWTIEPDGDPPSPPLPPPDRPESGAVFW